MFFRKFQRARSNQDFLINALRSLPFGFAISTNKDRRIFENRNYRALLDPFLSSNKRQDFLTSLDSLSSHAFEGKVIQDIFDSSKGFMDAPPTRVTIAPMLNHSDKIIVTVDDIQDILYAESVNSLSEFLEEAPIGFYSINESGKFIYINKAANEIFSKMHQSILGLSIRSFVTEDIEKLIPSHAHEILDDAVISVNNKSFRILQRLIKTDTSNITCSIIIKHTSNEASSPNLQTEFDFRSIFQDAPVSVILLDLSGKIRNANDVFCAMAQKKLREITGHKLADFFNKEYKKSIFDVMDQVKKTGQFKHLNRVHLLGNKETTLSLSVSVLFNNNRQPEGLVVYCIDMTEFHSLELQLAQSQKMQAIGQLAGGIAHDFNNLLTAMIGFCDLLLQRHTPAEQSFSDVMQIKQNANRAANLVRQLLAFSRQQAMQPRVINLADCISELSSLLRRLLGPSIQLEVKHDREVGFIKADESQIEQVIINLAVNARDAMERSGVLKISTKKSELVKDTVINHYTVPAGQYVLIEVEDTGSGIPPEIVNRIFEPFFSTKELGSGTGLGLSTVYGIVRQTGGFIFVESVMGEGTKFSIYLPQCAPEEKDSSAQIKDESKSKPDLTGSATILLVEDEDAVRIFSARALRDKGYHVIEASSGEQALDIFESKERKIDLIVTDVVMPNMDGPDLIKKIRSYDSEVKVVFISGYTEDSFRERLSQDNKIHFLPKPFNLKDLATKVKEVLQ